MRPLLISSIIGAATALLAFRALENLDRALQEYARRRTASADQPFSQKVLPLLELIHPPAMVRRRWATEAARRLLSHAGLPWTPDTYAAFRWLVLLGGLSLSLAFSFSRGWDLMGLSLGSLVFLSSWLGPRTWLRWQSDQREKEIDLSLPDFLDRMSLGLDAGLSFQIALQRTAANFPGVLGEELRRMVRQLERGYSRPRALEDLNQRTPSQELRAFTAAVKQSERLGTSLARSFRVQTELLRARRRRRAQEASRRLPILIVFPLVAFFLPSLLIIYLAPPLLHLFLGQ
jgi:tight adherence protein C